MGEGSRKLAAGTTIAAIIVAIAVIVYQVASSHEIYAELADVGEVRLKSPVLKNGIVVGEVDRVGARPGGQWVRIEIGRTDTPIRSEDRAIAIFESILGPAVEIVPGPTTAPVIQWGATIHAAAERLPRGPNSASSGALFKP